MEIFMTFNKNLSGSDELPGSSVVTESVSAKVCNNNQKLPYEAPVVHIILAMSMIKGGDASQIYESMPGGTGAYAS